MKKTHLTLGALAASALSASAALVGHYEFDNAANLGEATVGTDGTALSTSFGTAATGYSGGGIDTTGNATGVNLGTQYDSVFNTGVFTVTFRIKSSASTTDAPLLSWASWDNFDGGNRQGVTIATQPGTSLDLQAVISDGTERVDVGDGSSVPIDDNAWTLVALSVNSPAGTATLYTIGTGGTTSASGDLSSHGNGLGSRAASTFVIGEHGPSGGSDDDYNGGSMPATFDDVRVYDTALSQAQIEAIPEPSSTALLGLGGLALILRRRK